MSESVVGLSEAQGSGTEGNLYTLLIHRPCHSRNTQAFV
jgi:hypothetical protein